MANEVKEFFEKFKGDSAKMGKLMPEATSGFMASFGAIMKDGAIIVNCGRGGTVRKRTTEAEFLIYIYL